MSITKLEIAHELQEVVGLDKVVAKEFVDLVFEEIRSCLEQGVDVKLSGFGNFELRDKKPRPGRNPKTREPKLIQARRVVTFRSGQKLKSKLSDSVVGA